MDIVYINKRYILKISIPVQFGGLKVAKVFGFTPIELADGVLGEDFEKFWLEEYGPLGSKMGWISHVFESRSGREEREVRSDLGNSFCGEP